MIRNDITLNQFQESLIMYFTFLVMIISFVHLFVTMNKNEKKGDDKIDDDIVMYKHSIFYLKVSLIGMLISLGVSLYFHYTSSILIVVSTPIFLSFFFMAISYGLIFFKERSSDAVKKYINKKRT